MRHMALAVLLAAVLVGNPGRADAKTFGTCAQGSLLQRIGNELNGINVLCDWRLLHKHAGGGPLVGRLDESPCFSQISQYGRGDGWRNQFAQAYRRGCKAEPVPGTVFISHTREDFDDVKFISEWLTARGYVVFSYLDQNGKCRDAETVGREFATAADHLVIVRRKGVSSGVAYERECLLNRARR